jgi:PPOX class probable F420-dependent enzyme
MSEMTTAEYIRFLTEGTRTAKLATLRRDGRPHVVPVWFVLDGDDLLFRASRRDPRVAACIDDDRPPFAFVMIEGRATVIEDSHAVLITATRIARRYMGSDKAEEYARFNSVDGMMAVRITPDNIASEDNVTDIGGVTAGEA